MWHVSTREFFVDWFLDMSEEDQINVRASIGLLEAKGPHLGRPHVDTLNDSKHTNMKELRVQSNGKPIRVFFAFDPERNAILLCGGDKSGARDKRFYKDMIPIADREYDDHLKELEDEKK